jgi:hypothetical protein
MSTFVFNNIKTFDRYPDVISEMGCSIDDMLIYKQFYNSKDKIVYRSSNKKTFIRPELGNGLLSTIFKAYAQNIPLKLKPDDLWLSILISFSKYAQNNPEIMGDKYTFLNKDLHINIINIDNHDSIIEELLGSMNTKISNIYDYNSIIKTLLSYNLSKITLDTCQTNINNNSENQQLISKYGL